MKTNKNPFAAIKHNKLSVVWGVLSVFFLSFLFFSCSRNGADYDAIGTFDATEIIVSSEVTGVILQFNITEGDKLTKGKQVGLIDSLQLHLQKQQLVQNIKVIEANRPAVSTQLAPLKEQLAKQREEKMRVENLLKAEAATQKQLDDINSSILVLEKQIRAQENLLGNAVAASDAQKSALETQIAQLNDRLAKCRIASPIDGIVLSKYMQTGELTSTGRPLMKIADMDNIHLKAYVIASQLADIKLGQTVKVRADFGGENYRNYEGKITWISEKSEFTPKNITTSDDRANMVYAIKISVQNDGYLKLGMYGGVNFN